MPAVRSTRSLTSRARHVSAIAALLFTVAVTASLAASSKRTHHRASAQALISGASRTDCAYTGNSINLLRSFQRLVNKSFDCVLVFNNAAPNWAGWDNPWFLSEQGNPNANWLGWVTTPGMHRELIITQGMFPSDVNGADWLHAGASGAYVSYARTLARKLVAAGLGNAVIRLGHEANDSASPWFIGTTAQSWREWDEYWRQTVTAMRSVRGGHFLFDWCINAYYEPISLADWYPGNSYVNIIGIDAYDSGVPAGANRWSTIYSQPDGIKTVLRFAAAHGKPVSIPEWGLSPPGASEGGGDDPTYIQDIAGVVKNNPVAYQSYFYNNTSATLLAGSPLSLAAYRQSFGGG